MTKKEEHNKLCRKSKKFKPTFEGCPYPGEQGPSMAGSGIFDGVLYTCNLCGLQFILIRFKDKDPRKSGVYWWKGSETKYKLKNDNKTS